MDNSVIPQDILDFWFKEIDATLWFKQDDQLDEAIIHRFCEVHNKASAGELSNWRETIHGRLAEIIILDQFSRNMFRGKSEAFKQDAIALVLSQEALRIGQLEDLTTEERSFLYMPFMHSESLVIHDKAMALFQEEGMEENLKYEKEHRDIIKRFGRYPHRNDALGRESTDEECEFLKDFDSF